MPPLLDPDEREAEVRNRVADEVVCPVAVERDEDGPAVDDRGEPGSREARRERVAAVLDFHRERPGLLGEVAERRRPQELAALDRDEEVADPLDLAEEVRGDDDRDPELAAGSKDQLQHLVAAGRIEAVRGLVEQQQPGIVDERLGELDPLLHPRRVAADRPVPLLVQAHVAEDLGGPLPGRGLRQAGHQREMRDDVGRRGVRRQAVVLGHVADVLADVGALGPDVEVEDRRRSARRVDEPEQDLDQRALAGAVRADEADDARSMSTVRPSSAVTPPG